MNMQDNTTTKIYAIFGLSVILAFTGFLSLLVISNPIGDKFEPMQNNKVIGTNCTLGRSLVNVKLINCKNVEVGNSSGLKNEPIEIQNDTNANYTYTINGWKRTLKP